MCITHILLGPQKKRRIAAFELPVISVRVILKCEQLNQEHDLSNPFHCHTMTLL